MLKLPEDIIRQDDVVKQSIAEINLIEQVVRILEVIDRESSRLVEMIDSLSEGKKELVKKAYEYVRQMKEDAQNLKERVMEYLVRLAPSLINKEIYILTLENLDKLTQFIDEAAYKATIIANMSIELSSLSNEIQQLTRKLREMIKTLYTEAKKLTVNPREILSYQDEVCNMENEVDKAYRSIEYKLVTSKALGILEVIMLKEFIEKIEDIADYVRDLSYDFRYLALYRM